jgi:hypothetical protein
VLSRNSVRCATILTRSEHAHMRMIRLHAVRRCAVS